MKYVIGIDGGGTKTIAVLADKEGTEVARAVAGASNPNIVTPAQLKQTLQIVLSDLKQSHLDAYQQVTALYAGVSGAGHPDAQQQIRTVLISLVPASMQVTVDHDALIALYAGTEGNPGIVQISGTGSITYAINETGKRQRVGGWGHFIGERGSGYRLGHEALKAVFAVHDQVGPPTLLYDIVRQQFQISHIPDMIPLIYQATNPKEGIATLAKTVFRAAEEADPIAQAIIDRNGAYIGQSVLQLAQQLFANHPKNQAIPVVLAGSIFKRFDLLEDAIRQVIDGHKPMLELTILEAAPVYGAVMAALNNREGDTSCD
ncbi:N-acetylglucosamine kinase [Gracilibacillus phocaeensis]|uniref:N-acetylglucosamine kinase n=1 Tax=Gracilibacillus phocaeensis TaxID=2042304 RepID=UPI001031B904|nr:BadF/BadG/BcrA/BcrD ATPase family protein [Gracilibacillus phocaeensis]